PLAHRRQLLPGDLFHLVAMQTILQGQQLPNLFQTESQLLRSLDETEPLHVLRRIAADAAQRFHRLGHEPAPLVIADGFHIHPGPSGQSTDGASRGHIDSVVDYGPKVTPARDIATDSLGDAEHAEDSGE